MSDPTDRPPRWMSATGGHSDRQLHAMEFIASSLDRIDDHLEGIATSLAGSGSHKPFGEAVGTSCVPWERQYRAWDGEPKRFKEQESLECWIDPAGSPLDARPSINSFPLRHQPPDAAYVGDRRIERPSSDTSS
jgi:hypothetical protein